MDSPSRPRVSTPAALHGTAADACSDAGAPAASPRPLDRRAFLGGVGALTAAGLLAPSLRAVPALPAFPPPAAPAPAPAAPPPPAKGGGCHDEVTPLGSKKRRKKAWTLRVKAAGKHKKSTPADHCSNGDEELYPEHFASFSKGLPHDDLGHVDPAAYSSLRAALSSGDPAAFEAILTTAPGRDSHRRLVNPQAALAFDLQGADSHHLGQPPAPAFASAWQAGEMVEDYWMALLRDVPFTEYDGHPDVAAAAAELSSLSDYRGPLERGAVSARTLFRDDLPGALLGPYLSQFLWKPVPFGALAVDQRMRTLLPGTDFGLDKAEWLALQRGEQPVRARAFDPVPRFVRNGRDLSQWVHVDVLFQAYLNAALVLLAAPDRSDPVTGGGLGAPLDPGNPYAGSLTQEGFGTLGPPHVAALLPEVATRALKAVWFQKWCVHRRLRPEAYAGRVALHLLREADYPLHADVLDSEAVDRVQTLAGGPAFLPLAFPEGSPVHPSYGAGHATVAGACVTILKWFFDESFVVPDPVVPTGDGTALVDYVGGDAGQLTVGGELNKLASNIATGRNIAGVHWRTDGIESLRLGEAVAIALLKDQKATYNESFTCSFTSFDGELVTI